MNDNSIVARIKSPQELKNLSEDELKTLCGEIREIIVSVVAKNGGHLASNLGAVELTVALHRVFNNENDSLVWDVGHQSYTHKILTGRLEEIYSIRTENGISGFPKRSESPHDAFNVGHSSTSVSAAYGIAVGKQLSGDDSSTVAIIGDGAFTECGSLNITVGALSKLPILGTPIRNLLKRSKSRVRNLVYKRTLFDDLGFAYYGPVDGHDIPALEKALKAAKSVSRPVLVHVVTTKGKGYSFAENDPKSFHGLGGFDIDTGEKISSRRDFSGVFGDNLSNMADENKKICAITAAMSTGTGLVGFSKRHKDRFFDVGIAEEHAVTFACGLAVEGMIPVFAVYSTFLQRSVDQIIHDAAMQKLHIILAIDRAGVVGTDGETHQGVFDVALLNPVPNVKIYSPCYFDELELALYSAIDDDGVVAIRYPRGGQPYKPLDYDCTSAPFDIYGDKSSKVLLVTYGRLFANACRALDALGKEGKGFCILKLNRIKPIDIEAIKAAEKYKSILFFEEGMKTGGVGQSFLCMLKQRGYAGRLSIRAIDDEFVSQAEVERSLEILGLDEKSMAESVLSELSEV